MEIKKIILRSDGVKYLTIPKRCNLNAEDWVKIEKVIFKEKEEDSE